MKNNEYAKCKYCGKKIYRDDYVYFNEHLLKNIFCSPDCFYSGYGHRDKLIIHLMKAKGIDIYNNNYGITDKSLATLKEIAKKGLNESIFSGRIIDLIAHYERVSINFLYEILKEIREDS